MHSPHDVMLRSPAARSCRVAIAGTITNAATGEVMPQAMVSITAAPDVFGEGLLGIVTAAMAHCSTACYDATPQVPTPSVGPLSTAQTRLDACGQILGVARPDQTHSGGDGHYCFLDLPPGPYTLTATYSLADRCHGTITAQVEVPQICHWLTFAELDLAISLVPGASPPPVAEDARRSALPSDGPSDGQIPVSPGENPTPASIPCPNIPRAVALPH